MATISQPAEIEALNPPGYVLYWAKELKVANEAILKLKGGINNGVYRCGSSKRSYVIKGYRKLPPGTPDRMQAEVEFLRFAGESAKEYVPQLMEVDWQRRCVLLEYIPGDVYPDGYIPTESDVEMACEFVRRINSDRERAERFITMSAAEGYIRLTEHLENVSERIEKMSLSHLPACYLQPAEILLENVTFKLKETAERTIRQIHRGEISDAIDSNLLCISPSDFGFHNAIRNHRGLKFIDFEFSGWDDPAKLIADFVLQPRVPIRFFPPRLITVFRSDAARLIYRRCATLGPILRIKWLCIILSILERKRKDQLLATHRDVTVDSLIKQRLETATKHLSERIPFGLD